MRSNPPRDAGQTVAVQGTGSPASCYRRVTTMLNSEESLVYIDTGHKQRLLTSATGSRHEAQDHVQNFQWMLAVPGSPFWFTWGSN